MKITALSLINFKRFTNLSIQHIPADAKLVLLIGANGSGKSSVFDALECFNSFAKSGGTHVSPGYLNKDVAQDFQISFSDENGKTYSIPDGTQIKLPAPNSFYGRTSFRQTPSLTRTSLGQKRLDLTIDEDRPRSFIQRDERFENDVEHITGIILRDIFRTSDSTGQIRARYIEPINAALERVFGHENGTQLRLLEIIPPLEGNVAQINFEKGRSIVHYDLLSAGEKEVFNVLVNLLSRRDQHQDTVYFYDELDVHLNTTLQHRFLAEITENWIPDNCQLWTASHSLGFIDYAKKNPKAVIIDFDSLDFDYPQILSPLPKDDIELYEIAVPRFILANLLKDKKIVFCENQNDQYYNAIGLEDTVFVGLKDSRDVYLQAKRDPQYKALRDRDFLSDTEIERIENKFPNYKILRYYDFENYLYHPENIAALSPSGFVLKEYVAEILRQKSARVYHILAVLDSSRKNYEEFKTNETLREKSMDHIIEALKSEDFAHFYKYFDMKEQFNKSIIATYNLRKEDLVRTGWFRSRISELLR